MRTFGLILCLVSFMILVPAGLVTAQDKLIELDLKQLAIDYDKNELAAELKYKGKKVRLTEVIIGISSRFLSPDEVNPFANIYIGKLSLKLFFTGDQRAALSRALDSLINKEPLTMTCTIAENEFLGLKMRDCVIE